MRYVIRHLLLVALFLLAQAGALAHELGHTLDQAQPDKTVCAQCLAYAPIGAGVASPVPVWYAPVSLLEFDSPPPATSHTGFRPIYQSRAPPSTC
jgi:hypothetical protein